MISHAAIRAEFNHERSQPLVTVRSAPVLERGLILHRVTEQELAYYFALAWLDELEPLRRMGYGTLSRHYRTRPKDGQPGRLLTELDEVVRAALSGELAA